MLCVFCGASEADELVTYFDESALVDRQGQPAGGTTSSQYVARSAMHQEK